MTDIDQPDFANELDREIAFQTRWRTYCMLAYSFTTIGTIVLTAASTILAAFKVSEYAAICAAVATILIGTEKSLLFREKWKLHLTIFTKLNSLRRKVLFGKIEAGQAVEQLNQILENYSSGLPVAPREE
jgi:hypothetical protein